MPRLQRHRAGHRADLLQAHAGNQHHPKNTTHPFCKGPTVLNSSIPGRPIEFSWGLTPVNVYVGFNLTTSFQAFTTSPVWISTVHWHKRYQREELWMSPSPFTLHHTRYRGGSCINRVFVWGRLTEQSLTFPLWGTAGFNQTLLRVGAIFPSQGSGWCLNFPCFSFPTHSINLPSAPYDIWGHSDLRQPSPWLHLHGDFPWHCWVPLLTGVPGSHVPLQQGNPHTLQKKEISC